MKVLIYKNLFFFILGITLFSCGEIEKHEYKVEYVGALKKMMHEGDISAKIDLNQFEYTEHLYAIGAFEDLKGEIQIFDGKPFNSVVVDNALLYNPTFDKKATLFVYASVYEWESFDIPADIITYEQLEKYIDKTATEYQINMDAPFPFLIEGTPTSFDWHVINWKDGDTEHSHEKHIQSGLHGTLENKPVEMLGFYSDSHHAIFTHHTTNMHIHVKTDDNEVAGHVDGLTLGSDMILKLPKK